MPAWSLAVVAAASTLAVLAAGFALGSRAGRRRPGGGDDPRSVRGDAPPTAGQTIAGRYWLVRELGRGGTGTVHLADDLLTGQPVALKTLCLPAGLEAEDRAEARARFAREGALARRLRHPDIVEIRDAGEAAGIAFIAMEPLAGTDLSHHTGAGALLPVETLLRIGARIALALDHAHRQGIVHRDVKPANVMWNAATGTVKVTDFGIARHAAALRTRTGVLLGTPAYASPEQLAGGRVDGRSDVFSLAVMLHELLTGSLPYRPGTGPAELLRQIAVEPPVRLGAARPGLPAALEALLARALEKHPSARHADAGAFAEALLAVADRLRAGPSAPAG